LPTNSPTNFPPYTAKNLSDRIRSAVRDDNSAEDDRDLDYDNTLMAMTASLSLFVAHIIRGNSGNSMFLH